MLGEGFWLHRSKNTRKSNEHTWEDKEEQSAGTVKDLCMYFRKIKCYIITRHWARIVVFQGHWVKKSSHILISWYSEINGALVKSILTQCCLNTESSDFFHHCTYLGKRKGIMTIDRKKRSFLPLVKIARDKKIVDIRIRKVGSWMDR